MRRRVLEEYAEFLSPVRWPHALGLFASACSGGTGDSPHYLTGQYLMNLCYQFDVMYEKYADDLVKAQSKRKLWTPVSRNSLIAGMYVATLLHETGHAAFDIMDIPVFGREEDAADQFEGLLALQFGKETARTVIKGDAYFWYVEVSDLKADPPIPGTGIIQTTLDSNVNLIRSVPMPACTVLPVNACTTCSVSPLAASPIGSRTSSSPAGFRQSG